MKKFLFIVSSSFVIFVLTLFVGKIVRATEGTVELRSTTGEDYRCFASSLLMESLNYLIGVSCRDLIYPADETVFTYIMWATPRDDDRPVKLGALGFGKAQFNTRSPFVSLFVTTEQDARTRDPQGPVVMRGSVESIRFLERPTTPTPNSIDEEAEETPDEATPQKRSLRERVLIGLRRAGFAALLAIIGIVGLVFVLTRPR